MNTNVSDEPLQWSYELFLILPSNSCDHRAAQLDQEVKEKQNRSEQLLQRGYNSKMSLLRHFPINTPILFIIKSGTKKNEGHSKLQ